MEDATVEIRIKRRPDKTMYYEVLVSSVVKPGLKNKGILEFSRSNQKKEVAVLAGALAEDFCDKYNDTADPRDAFLAAERAYDKVMALLLGSGTAPTPQLGDEQSRDADPYMERAN